MANWEYLPDPILEEAKQKEQNRMERRKRLEEMRRREAEAAQLRAVQLLMQHSSVPEEKADALQEAVLAHLQQGIARGNCLLNFKDFPLFKIAREHKVQLPQDNFSICCNGDVVRASWRRGEPVRIVEP